VRAGTHQGRPVNGPSAAQVAAQGILLHAEGTCEPGLGLFD